LKIGAQSRATYPFRLDRKSRLGAAKAGLTFPAAHYRAKDGELEYMINTPTRKVLIVGRIAI